MKIEPATFCIEPQSEVDLGSLPTFWTEERVPDRELKQTLRSTVVEFAKRQEVLYADKRHALLVVFQGMDTAGKDSAITRVTMGVNPHGFKVSDFRQPTYREIEHTYMRRYWLALPTRGRIGIFNRSLYEEVVTTRVHPELFQKRKLPDEPINEGFWSRRLNDIREFEGQLTADGISVVKFFLHISRDVQRQRIIKRLSNPTKHWKFDPRDLTERAYWDDYQRAYESAIGATSTRAEPWYVIPADHKPMLRVIVASIIVAHLDAMNIAYPQPSAENREAIEIAKRELAAPASEELAPPARD